MTTTKPTRTRANALVVMMTESEKDQVRDIANAKGMTLSEIARDYIAKGIESDKPTIKEYLKTRQAKYNTQGNPAI